MVETQQNNQVLDVKISLDRSVNNKYPIFKRVAATDFATLTNHATALAAEHSISEDDVKLRYFDGENWVIVEDDQDLQLALTNGRNGKKLVHFCINKND